MDKRIYSVYNIINFVFNLVFVVYNFVIIHLVSTLVIEKEINKNTIQIINN